MDPRSQQMIEAERARRERDRQDASAPRPPSTGLRYNQLGQAAPPTLDELLELAKRVRAAGNADHLAIVHKAIARETERMGAKERQRFVDAMPPAERAVTAFGEGARHTIRQAANLLPGGLSDAEVEESAKQNAPLMARSPLAGALGSASIVVPTTVAAGAPLAGAGPLVSTLGNAALGAASGGTFSDPGQRGANATVGAIAGGGMTAGMEAGRSLLRGVAQPRGAGQVLADMGYADDLTIGQLNPNGWWNTVENAAESLPWAGKAVTAARERGAGVLQKALGKEVTPPGGALPTAVDKNAWYRQAKGNFGPAYDSIAQQGQVGGMFPGLPASIGQSIEAIPGMNSAAGGKAGAIIGKALEPLQVQGATWKGLQGARSYLRSAADAYRTSQAADDKLIAKALDVAERSMTAELEAGLPPAARTQLRDTDRAYSNLMTARDTIDAQRMALGESVSPLRFASEVWKRLPAETMASGQGGTMRDLAESAAEAFAPRSPSTGQRLLTLGGIGAGASATGHPLAAGLGLAALRGAYTPAGQAFLKGRTAWQQAANRFFAGAPAGSALTTSQGASALIRALRRDPATAELLAAAAEQDQGP